MNNVYNYAELRANVLRQEATTEDRTELFRWFEQNDMRSWNGESFDIDDGLRLYPVYEFHYDEDGEILDVLLVDAEVK